MAKKNQLNVGIGVDFKGYAKSWDEVVKITQESGSDVEKEAAKMATSIRKKLENMTPKQQARQLENLTAKMVSMGLEGTKSFGFVASSAAKLKAEIDDTKGIIDALRPDAPFNALNTTLGASAQAFAGVQGAMALFGSESEDLQKTLVKVQGAMALAEGFKAIDGLTDGFQQLNMVIKANPLIAGAAAFVAVTAAIAAISDALDTQREKQQRLLDINKKAFDSTVTERSELKRLLTVYNDKNTTDKERLRIQNEIIKKNPEYFGQISTNRIEQEKLNNAVINFIDVLMLQAKAQAGLEMYIEAQKELHKTQQDIIKAGGEQAIKMAAARVGVAGEAVAVIRQLREQEKAVKELEGYYYNLAKAADEAANKQKTVFGSPETPTGGGGKTSTENVPMPTAYKPYGQISPKVNPLSEDGTNPFPAVPDETIQSVDVLGKSFVNLNDTQKDYLNVSAQVQAEHDRIVESMARLEEIATVLNQSIKALAVDAISSFSMALGETIGGSEDAMESFGKKLLGAIVSFMETVSKAMIASAIASDLFQKTLFANPIAALGAGIALGIAAGIVKSQMTKGVQGEGFAKGGLIGGNSFSGDKLFAPVNSGEVILNTGQQNALLRLANGGGSGYMAETRISGRDLAIVLKKYQIDNARG